MRRYIFAVALFFAASVCDAAPPKVFFSDMQDGVASGFNSSSTQGAAISIWGLDFGTTRGSSYVSVGGVDLTNDASYAEWGATTNPTTARGLQRITFYLNSSMTKDGIAPNTSIVVTTADGSSTAIPFHVRSTGHIYFLSPTGNDSANGLTTLTPWKTGKKLRTSLAAGDIVYLRSGIYLDVDDGYSVQHGAWIDLWPGTMMPNSGTRNNSIGISAYPGETPQIGDGDLNWTSNPKPEIMFNRFGTGSGVISYWTISKIKTVLANGTWVDNAGSTVPWGDVGLRFVGNDIRTTSTHSATGISFVKEGGTQGSSYFYLYGNYLHHNGVPLPPEAPTLSSGIGTGLTGQYSAKYSYLSYRSTDQVGQESEMSEAGDPIVLSNGALRIAWSQPSANRQNGDANRDFTHVRIYRTVAGGSTYYFDSEVPLTDGQFDLTIPDSTLSTRLDPRTATFNPRPPAAQTNTTIQGGYYVGPMYFGGYGTLDHIYVGWNEIFNANGTAIQNYGHTPADRCSFLYFHDNYIHDSSTCAWNGRPSIITGGGDGGANYDYAYDVYIYNNIVARNGGPGIRIDAMTWGGGGTYYIYNNTFYGNATLGGENFEMGGSVETTMLFRNNIVYATRGTVYNTAFYGSPQNSDLGFSGDHNIWYGLGDGPTWSSDNLDDTNPLIVSATDLSLQSNSPAIGAGTDVSISTPDFLGISRGSVFDIGAYEYADGTGEPSNGSIFPTLFRIPGGVPYGVVH